MTLILDLVGYAKLSRAKRKELKKMRDKIEKDFYLQKQEKLLSIIETYNNLGYHK